MGKSVQVQVNLVEVRGLEPLTPCLQTRCYSLYRFPLGSTSTFHGSPGRTAHSVNSLYSPLSLQVVCS